MHVPTIAERVREHALRAPDHVAMRWPGPGFDRDDPHWQDVTWGELDARSDAFARGLAARGVDGSSRVALFVRAGPEWLALVLGCWKLGALAIVTPTRPEPGRALDALRRSRPGVLVASVWLQRLRTLFQDAFASVELAVVAGRPWWWSGVRLADLAVEGPDVPPGPGDADRPALLELPDEGPARRFDHGQLVARAERLWAGSPPPGDRRTLETAWSRVFAHLVAGRSTVWPRSDPRRPGSLQPADWLAALAHHDVELAVAGSEVFGREAARPAGRRLGAALAVAGPLPGAWMPTWREHIDKGGAFSVVFGTAGAGPVARIEAREVRSETLDKTRRGAGYCVGRPLAGVAVRVVRVTEAPIPDLEGAQCAPGEVGEIAVAGPGVLVAYDDPELQDQLVIDERWLRTAWLGYVDEDGRIWVCSRLSHRIESSSGRVLPLVVEGLFEGDADVVRCALVGVGPRGAAVPVLVVQLEEGRELSDSLATRLGERLAAVPHAGVGRLLAHPRLPLTPRGEPDREALRPWVETRCTDLVTEAT